MQNEPQSTVFQADCPTGEAIYDALVQIGVPAMEYQWIAAMREPPKRIVVTRRPKRKGAPKPPKSEAAQHPPAVVKARSPQELDRAARRERILPKGPQRNRD